ncbi:MAG: hypothetical protein WBK20_03805 [Spirochaetota bacterium]
MKRIYLFCFVIIILCVSWSSSQETLYDITISRGSNGLIYKIKNKNKVVIEEIIIEPVSNKKDKDLIPIFVLKPQEVTPEKEKEIEPYLIEKFNIKMVYKTNVIYYVEIRTSRNTYISYFLLFDVKKPDESYIIDLKKDNYLTLLQLKNPYF